MRWGTSERIPWRRPALPHIRTSPTVFVLPASGTRFNISLSLSRDSHHNKTVYHLIFIMGIPTSARWHIYIERAISDDRCSIAPRKKYLLTRVFCVTERWPRCDHCDLGSSPDRRVFAGSEKKHLCVERKRGRISVISIMKSLVQQRSPHSTWTALLPSKGECGGWNGVDYAITLWVIPGVLCWVENRFHKSLWKNYSFSQKNYHLRKWNIIRKT